MNYRDKNIDQKIDKLLFEDLASITVRDIQRKYNISSNRKILVYLTYLYQMDMVEIFQCKQKTIYRAQGSYLNTLGFKYQKYEYEGKI
ncbi:hypothetical protein [Francisella sp. TX07-6608]|uniref:hypothetical protein n=1 Tax=Francisella sp. TX07-6608 TaxID=573568 RepID=UPI0008F98F0B|nr:hypothetical protein [Francisella sp. TX07-6608]OIN84999.1 hypothetical protein KX00_2296 [Francisella sp. TX07-6608]OIN85026.1 hypothetical protein KX00_2222 [Francisella sp. TX07-6608]